MKINETTHSHSTREKEFLPGQAVQDDQTHTLSIPGGRYLIAGMFSAL